MRHTISELGARRLLGGGPVVLVTTAWRGNYNVMPAAFVTPISFDPPLVGLAVHPSRHTHDMIKYSEELVLNVATRELLHHCQYLGSVTGRELNKLEVTKLPTLALRAERRGRPGRERGLRRDVAPDRPRPEAAPLPGPELLRATR